jgi:quercetin dioxygenase-like cupin family protein
MYRIDWESLPWMAPMPGVRFKAFQQNGRRLRLAEFSRGFVEPDWCRKGHVGYILEGEGDLQIADSTVRLTAGDGLFIPPGDPHRHKLTVLSNTFRIFLVETV